MNEAPSEVMQKHILMAGVKDLPMFTTLVQTLSLQAGVLTFDEIVTHLVDHQERMRREASSSNRKGDVASYAQATGAGGQQRGRNGNRFGRQGQSNGGNRAQQPQVPSGQRPFSGSGSGASNNGDNRACFTCNQVGHISFDCPQNINAKKC